MGINHPTGSATPVFFFKFIECLVVPGTMSSIYYLFIYLFIGLAGLRDLLPPHTPGIEPMRPAVEAQSLNHWTTREVPCIVF